jgi:hypothetical protein
MGGAGGRRTSAAFPSSTPQRGSLALAADGFMPPGISSAGNRARSACGRDGSRQNVSSANTAELLKRRDTRCLAILEKHACGGGRSR